MTLTQIVHQIGDRVRLASKVAALTGGTKAVDSVVVTAGGSGYTLVPTVVFTPSGPGSGAAGTAVLSGGVVIGITMTNPGSGYTSAPTVSFTGGGGGSGATATAITLATTLDAIPTLGISLLFNPNLAVEFLISGVLQKYRLVSGTDAEASPSVIRPDDYATTTNEKVWKLTTIAVSSLTPPATITGNADVVQLTVLGNGTQTAAIVSIQTSAAAVLFNFTNTGILQLSGTTSSFPALKRNGAALEVRLADDSARAALLALSVSATAGVTNSLGTITTNVIPYYSDMTWNNAAVVFHGLRFDVTDTASQATSRLLLFTVGGVTKLTVFKSGALQLVQDTITATQDALSATCTWNNSGVTFTAFLVSVTVTAAGAGSRYISILKNGADHALLDDLSRWHIFRATADNTSGNMTLFKRGTTGDATAVVAADGALGFYSVRGWNGTAYHSDGTGFFMFADELFSGTAGGTRIELRMVPNTTISNGAYVIFRSTQLLLQSGCRLSIVRGSLTANAPSIDITETWNAAVTFTVIKVNVTNTSSNGGSLLMDLQVGSISRFYVQRTGTIGCVRREADDQAPTIDFVKRGTTGNANGAIASGAILAAFDITGYDGTGDNTIATWRCVSLEAHTNTAHGTKFVFQCPAVGATVNSIRVTISAASFDLSAGCAYFLNGAAMLNPLYVYATGTVYTLTATSAAVDFGTTDPILTVNAAGTYKVRGRVKVNLIGATFAANRTLTVKLRRTNNTAADVANTITTWTIPITTTLTNTLAVIVLPEVAYTTANTNDTLTIFADVDVLPSAGSITIEEAAVMAIRTS